MHSAIFILIALPFVHNGNRQRASNMQSGDHLSMKILSRLRIRWCIAFYFRLASRVKAQMSMLEGWTSHGFCYGIISNQYALKCHHDAYIYLNSSPASMPHICVGELVQHWFISWLGAEQATSHYVNQWWFIVIWTPEQISVKLIRNFNIFIQDFFSENVVCVMADILFRGDELNIPATYFLHTFSRTIRAQWKLPSSNKAE